MCAAQQLDVRELNDCHVGDDEVSANKASTDEKPFKVFAVLPDEERQNEMILWLHLILLSAERKALDSSHHTRRRSPNFLIHVELVVTWK